MPSPLESITTVAVALALDAAQLRQQAAAANIANHSTQGYVPLEVDFDAQMAQARRVLESQGSLDAATVRGVHPRLVPSLDAAGHARQVRLDEEMADMAQSSVHYQALARGLARHFSILSAAVADGKR